jgi:hypothetical protein
MFREKLILFNELADIFNENDNQALWRELLSRVSFIVWVSILFSSDSGRFEVSECFVRCVNFISGAMQSSACCSSGSTEMFIGSGSSSTVRQCSKLVCHSLGHA